MVNPDHPILIWTAEINDARMLFPGIGSGFETELQMLEFHGSGVTGRRQMADGVFHGEPAIVNAAGKSVVLFAVHGIDDIFQFYEIAQNIPGVGFQFVVQAVGQVDTTKRTNRGSWTESFNFDKGKENRFFI